MAIRDFNSITAVLVALFLDQIINQINRAVVLAQILDVKPGTGKNIQWPIKTGQETPDTAPIPDGADVTQFNQDDKDPAVLQYNTYHDAFVVTGRAIAAAQAAGNPSQLAQVVVDELGDSIQRLARAIARDCYTGPGTVNRIHGLYAVGNEPIGDQGSYGGVSRAAVPQWQGNVVPAGGADLTAIGANGIREAFNFMRELEKTIYDASGTTPDLYICDSTQHARLGLAFQQERRYVQEVTRGDGTVVKLDGGYQVLEFDGKPIIRDVLHPPQRVSALNTGVVYLSQLPDGPDAANRAMGSVQLQGTPEAQFGVQKVPLTARLQPLAITGDAYKYALYVYPQLWVKRPNATGYLDNLAT
jgi:hypothetical protein